MKNQPKPLPDIFITNKKEDTLGREELVVLIVKAILAKRRENSHKALSVGIYGEWGEGKTSLMKMVETELKKIIKKDREKDQKRDLSKDTEEPEEEDAEELEEEDAEELEEEDAEELEEEDTKEYEEEDIDNTNKGKLV